MNRILEYVNSQWNIYLSGSLICISAVVIQQSPLIFEQIVPQYGTTFSVSKDPLTQVIDTSDVPIGIYYLSVGRPHGRCKIIENGEVRDSNYNIDSPVRDRLLLGSSIIVTSNHYPITIECRKYKNPILTLNHKPVLTRHFLGVLLQNLRGLTYLFLGPIAAIFLFISIMYVSTIGNADQRDDPIRAKNIEYLIFSIVGVFYAFSLAHFTRTFFSEESGLVTHIVTRHIYSISYALIAISTSKVRIGLLLIHFLSIVLTLVFYNYSVTGMLKFYKFQYSIFWCTGLIAYYMLSRAQNRRKFQIILSSIAFAWVLSQTIDWTNLLFKFGAYNSPALLAMVSFLIIYGQLDRAAQSKRIEAASRRLVDINRSISDPMQLIQYIAYELSSYAKFVRVSAYLDGFSLGIHSKKGEKYSRVYEYGYKKDTTGDQLVDFTKGQGSKMKKTFESGEILFEKGGDQEWFAIVPVGGDLCINLSISQSSNEFVTHESLELLRQIAPVLGNIESRLTDLTVNSRLKIHKIRALRGIGRWDVELGSVFIDISNFAKLTEESGGLYSSFIANHYFPALTRALHGLALTEYSKGDELYLIIIQDILPEGKSIPEATAEVILKIHQFQFSDGATLSIERGMEPPRYTMGVAIGTADLMVTEAEVKTAGQSVNIAKRLQESARSGECMIAEETSRKLERFGIQSGSPKTVLRKKSLITGRKFLGEGYKSAA